MSATSLDHRRFAGSGKILQLDPGFLSACAHLWIGDAEELASGRLGVEVTRHRSSWVHKLPTKLGDVYVKTYVYRTYRDRVRGLFRTTFLAASRVAREAAALDWLSGHGFSAPQVLLVYEQRSFYVLNLAVLVTMAAPGMRLDHHLALVGGADRGQTLAGLLGFVQSLHAAGFRDRNLDPRNILVDRCSEGVGCFSGFRFTKIDSPRYRLVQPGSNSDSLAMADWARLRAGLEQDGFALPSDKPWSGVEAAGI